MSTAIAQASPAQPLIAPYSAQNLAECLQIAQMFAKSRMVPAHFQGKVEDCYVAIEMAKRLQIDPMMALQNIYVVSGKPGLSGALVISLINSSGKIRGRLKFRIEGTGDALAVTASATLVDGDTAEFTATMQMAKAEGWTSNKKYLSMPEVMLRYRAATFLARFNFPEVILGMHSAEEWEDVESSEGTSVQRTAVAASVSGTALLAAKREPRKAKAEATPVAETPAETPEPEKPETTSAEAPAQSENDGPPSSENDPRWPTGIPPFDIKKPAHHRYLTSTAENLKLDPDVWNSNLKGLSTFLAARKFPAMMGFVEDQVRAYLKQAGITPPDDVPAGGDEA